MLEVMENAGPAPEADLVTIAPEGPEKGGKGGEPDAPATIPPTVPAKGGEGGELPPSPPLASPFAENVAPPAAEFVADGVFTPAPRSNLVIAGLREQGHYLRALGDGRHAVECPWAHDHGGEGKGEAIYTEPTPNIPYGQYRCPHSHADPVTIMALLDRLDIEPQRARGKARVRVEAGEQNLVLATAQHVLAGCDGFYQSKGSIVCLQSGAGQKDVTVALATEQTLSLALAKVADWEKWDGRSKAYVPSDPPARLCQMMLKATDHGSLPELNGIARQPYFRKGDGTLVMRPGHDAVSGIYARFDAKAYDLPEPTPDAANVALARMLALVEEFYFATDTDRSAALCAMLTATVRSSLPLAPAFNVTAATSGSGKSYLTASITPFAGPGEPLNMSYPGTSDEASKAMLAALIQAPAVIAFDDMQTDWLPFGVMNRMLTSDTISERVLGSSRMVTAGTNCFIIGTGNNVGPVRDMCRRVVSIRLAPPSSAPAMLTYKGKPVETVRANRAAYVSDALTIMRAWAAAGSPKAEVSPIGSFSEWSDMCRQPLIWLGLPDPATSLMEQVKSDPDTAALGAFMEAWTYEFGQKAVQVRKIIKEVEDHPDNALAEAIYDLPVMDRNVVNHSKLGWFLKKNAERIIDGYVIRQVITPERRAWAVTKVD